MVGKTRARARRRVGVAAALIALGAIAGAVPARAEPARDPRAYRPLPKNAAALARAKADAARRAGGPPGGPDAPGPSTAASPSWEGANDTSVTPSDSTGAIGPTRYVEMVNSVYAVYDRTGSLLESERFTTLTGDASGAILCDPQVIWDPSTDRFYFVILDCGGVANTLRYGFSKTDSPSAVSDWCTYILDYGYGTLLPDFPKLGDTTNFLLIGVNVFEGNTFVRADLDWVRKPSAGTSCPESVTTGMAQDLREEDGTQAFTAVPANQTDGSTTGYAVSAGDPGPDSSTKLTVFTATESGSTLTVATTGTTVPVTEFSVPPNAPQAGTSVVLDTSDTRLTQAVSAIDPSEGGGIGLWTQHTVAGGGGSVVRWYEVDPAGATLRRSGTAFDPSLYAFNGAISPDRARTASTQVFGDSMVLGFNTSSSSTYPAIQMVWQTPAQAQSAFVLVKQSPGFNRDFSCSGLFACRWGDYPGASPDPAADPAAVHGTVWLTNMWNVASSNPQTVDWRSWNWAMSPADATIKLSASSYTVGESDGQATITAARSGDTASTVSVQYATANGSATAGSDYIASAGTLTFDPGETSATFDVPILADATVEGTESVALSLSDPTGSVVLGSPSSATLQIIDDDTAIRFSAATYAAGEAAGTATITVERIGVTAGTDSVTYSTSDGTATADADYAATSDTLTFTPGETSETFEVSITQDQLYEGSETFSATLGTTTGNAILGSPSSATITIVDDDGVPTLQFGASAYSTQESASAVVVVTRSGATGNAVSVSYSTTDGTASAGSDFTAVSGTLDFSAGQTAKSISIPVTNDTVTEAFETFTITLSAPSPPAVLGGTVTATVKILKSDQRPDGWIKLSSDSSYIGNNIYNTTASHQTRATSAHRGAKRVFYVRLQNDGNSSNIFRLKGSGSGSGHTVRYYKGTSTTSITTAVVNGTYSTAAIAAGSTTLIRIEITIGSTATIGSVKSALLTGTWTGDGTRKDAVKASVTVS